MPNFYKAEHDMLAAALRKKQPPPVFGTESTQHYSDCLGIAEMLLADNPSFNMAIFLKACGYSNERGKPIGGHNASATS